MANSVAGYAFDIEGTLYKGGKLQAGVPELFQFLTQQKKPIMFVSGMNLSEMTKVVSQIEKESNVNLSDCTFASNAGSVINKDAKTVQESALSPEEVKEIRRMAQKIAPGSVMVFRTRLNNYREKAIEADTIPNKIRKGITIVLKVLLQVMRKIELHTIPTNRTKLNKMIDNKECYSLDIIAMPKQAVELAKAVKEKFPKLKISGGASLQVSNKDKWAAIESQFADKARDVCYFGDNANDIKCIMNCDRAILSNATKTKMFEVLGREQSNKKQKFATHNFNNSELFKYISGQEYKLDDMVAMTKDAMLDINDTKKVEKEK